MYYIGSKTSKNCTPDNTKDYYGSPRCKVFKEAIQTRPETLVKTIVAVCQTGVDALAFESRLHKEMNVVSDPMSYNKINQSSDGFSMQGLTHSEETKSKIAAAAKRMNLSLDYKVKLSAAKKGKLPHNKGKKTSEATKAKLSAVKLGRKDSESARANKSSAAKAAWAKRKQQQQL
jgi:hypothetical protein